ncbi:MAG: glycerophosphodiester phosphodiesterase [Planctomycetes bacterium]|nr:glycerophosphodiester phosphodiesterase [Planctomycetota bacterium]
MSHSAEEPAASALPLTEPAVAEIIGHRGASYDAPENTLESFQLGWQQHADAVELDIMISSDGRIVVIHDKDTKRLAGVDRLVADQSFEELRKLDVGRWKDPRWEGTRIPRFKDVLASIPAGKRLFIEIKCGSEVLPELKRELAEAKRPAAQTALIGFSARTMADAKRAFPDLEVYWIVDIKPNPKTGKKSPSVEELIQGAKETGVDGLDLSAHETIDRPYATKIREAGLKLAVWTVNDPKLARQMIAAGVQGITTDRPGWMREQLKKSE